MSAQETAHKILVAARNVYQWTGWCKTTLLKQVEAGEERCLNGAMSWGIAMHCKFLPDYRYHAAIHYPEALWCSVSSPEDQEAILLAMETLATQCKEMMNPKLSLPRDPDHATDLEYAQGEIVTFNDMLSTTREDVLLALDKAIANS